MCSDRQLFAMEPNGRTGSRSPALHIQQSCHRYNTNRLWHTELHCTCILQRIFRMKNRMIFPRGEVDTSVSRKLYCSSQSPSLGQYAAWRSQWPCGLRRRSSATRLLRSWVRIPPKPWMFVLWVLCVVREGPLRRTDHSFRGVLPTVARRCMWSRNLVSEEAKAH